MTLVPAVKLALITSVLLQVFALGLRSNFSEATTLLRNAFRPPHRLLRALVAMYVLVPTVAATMAAFLDLELPVEIALVAIAVSPIPPILPGKQIKLGGRTSYSYGLLVAVSLVSIVVVPLAIQVLGRVFDREDRVGFVDVAKPIFVTVLLPLLAGLIVAKMIPALADRGALWFSRVGNVLLLAGSVCVLVVAWPAIQSLLGGGTAVAMLAVIALAIAAGHALGGPDPHDRTALAIASAMRHPGVALAIARLQFPEEKLVPAAVILYLVLAAIGTTIYGRLRGRGTRAARGEVPART